MIRLTKYLNLILLINIMVNSNIISVKEEDLDQVIRESCIITDMPQNIILNIVHEVIKSHINSWFYIADFNKINKQLKIDLFNILSTSKKFSTISKEYILYITMLLKKIKHEQLKKQLKIEAKLKYENLSKEALDLKLKNIINKFYLFAKDFQKILKLILAGANVNCQNDIGITPLMWAAMQGHKYVAKMLINASANINIEDQFRNDALLWASINDNKNIAKLLINNGAYINHQNNYMYTALMWAIDNNNKDMIKMLINKKTINLNAKDDKGRTALMLIAGKHTIENHDNYKEIIQMLINNDADINTKDDRGRTATEIAKKKGNTYIEKLLEKYQKSNQ